MLKVEPIKIYKSPSYPDKRMVLQNPQILKTLPQRWKGKLGIGLTFSSIALLLLSGCQIVPTAGIAAPPVYLSEEQAYSIVVEEAKKYGVIFDEAALELKDIEFHFDNQSSEDKPTSKYVLNVQLDGYDKERNIGFEFLSENDTFEFNNDIAKLAGDEIQHLWINDYSEILEKGIKQNNETIYFDAFYTDVHSNPEVCEANLRAQVISFMEWLKSEGVI